MGDSCNGPAETPAVMLQSGRGGEHAPGADPAGEPGAFRGMSPAVRRPAYQEAEAGDEAAREVVARVARRTFTPLDPAGGERAGDIAAWVVKHISTHFAEPITLDDLARGVQLSKYHFLRKFRKEVGITPGAFLKRYRIVQAMERLVATRRPIREVARMVGYKDATAFSRAFIRVTGTQPYLFRETRRSQAAEEPEKWQGR